MPATTASPARTRKTPAEPRVLENFYTVAEAAVRLKLRDADDPTTKGEKVLRDGVNLHGWPCHRYPNRLLFSDSDLAEIAELHRNRKDKRAGRRSPTSGYRPRRSRTKTPASGS
ncbi:hypothetical protein L0F81_25190 [Streptomyces tricolor]|uniref:Uncharacterized protein n=1 Tax=Streptomyces tricolor TaxID=68277 RepID=A0ABS9JLW7_9ACTN|nr:MULTISPECIES: hypothetical protein [Streptomyces]MCG0066538.1 hypothetical protein [Streptomyces tricolor]BCM70936.1 hypothetical protein EASAB2608_06270 [Streptomyces sp. EAS-AB2608]